MKKIDQQNPKDLLSIARVQLLVKKPFFGQIAMWMNFIESETAGVGTTCVDAKGNMYYNPKWVQQWPGLDEATFELAHEVMHLVLKVSGRLPAGGNRSAWNTAIDIVDDTLLEESGMPRSEISKKAIPEELIERFRGCTSEQVYYALLSEQPEQKQEDKQEGDGAGVPGEPKGNENDASKGGRKCISGHLTGEDMDAQTIAIWKQRIVAAAMQAKSKGDAPGFLDAFIADITKPSITWKDIVRRTATSVFRGATTMKRPSRRSHGIGVRLPAQRPTKQGAVIAIDTSGSISDKELSQALSECTGILRQMGCKYVNVYFHDVDCYHHETYTINSIKKVKVKRGGTSHIDVFNQIEEHEPQKPGMVICFTDLETTFPAEEPSYPVLWVHSPGCRVDNPPWGKKVQMELT